MMMSYRLGWFELGPAALVTRAGLFCAPAPGEKIKLVLLVDQFATRRVSSHAIKSARLYLIRRPTRMNGKRYRPVIRQTANV
jgi:hypothetical protein